MTYAADHHTIRPRRWNDTDNLLAGILCRHPDGLTRGEIARLLGRLAVFAPFSILAPPLRGFLG